MFFLTPSYVKHGRQFLKDARKLVAYKRDLLEPQLVEDTEREIGHLEVVLGSGNKEEIEAQMHRVDDACAKIAKPLPDAGMRDNVEVFLVAIVIALAVRTYFLQPFTIPTGSMQPTLNGIIGFADKETTNPLVQLFGAVFQGRTYVNVIAKDNETLSLNDLSEETRYRFFTYTKLTTSTGNTYWIHAPKKGVRDILTPEMLSPDGRFFGLKSVKAGEPLVRGYVNTGDHVFVDKFSYNFRKPERGEVFVFTTQGIPRLSGNGEPSQFYIKRLSGVPGDTLQIKAPNLYINGSIAQSEPFKRVMSGTFQHPVDGYQGYSNMPGFPLLFDPDSTVKINAGEYFALGDNSYNSSDSRNWGVVPQKNIMGRGVIVYWPFGSHWGFIH